jgi:hypothetical protein
MNEYTVIVLWHIMCNVVAHFLCLVKAEISQAYVSADRGHSSHNPQSLLRPYSCKFGFPALHEP